MPQIGLCLVHFGFVGSIVHLYVDTLVLLAFVFKKVEGLYIFWRQVAVQQTVHAKIGLGNNGRKGRVLDGVTAVAL